MKVNTGELFYKARTKLNQNMKNGKVESINTVSRKTNVPASSISLYERGDRLPNMKNAQVLAKYYGVNVQWLLGQSGSHSLDESSQAVTNATRLNAEAVEVIRSLRPEEIDCLNALLTSYDFCKSLLMFSQARIVSKRIEKWKLTEEMAKDPYAPQSADEYADMIEKANLFEINHHGENTWYTVGTGNTISDRQLVRMYRTEALQYIGNAFRRIAPADSDEREGK